MNGPKTLWDFLPFLLMGIPVTLEVTCLAMILVIPVSIILALARNSRLAVLRWPAGFVIELFRGSSALVQLFWAFYVLPFFGIDLPPLLAGVLVLGFNEGSYFSEVVRAGINVVPSGQREAAVALGFSPAYRFFRVTAPQALPIIIPPFGNALVTMLKFTSLVSLVTIQDLSFRAGLIGSSLGESGPAYEIIIVIYFILALLLAALAKLLERQVQRRTGREVELSPGRAALAGSAMGVGGRAVTSLSWDWGFAWSILPQLFDGLKLTVLATLLGSAIAFTLGLVWSLLRMARIRLVAPVVEFFIQFVRGTPLLVQLYCLFYVFPTWGVSLSALATGILGLGVFYSAYAAEIYRAGIEDLPMGQWEAALTLGLPLRRVWLGVVLPQSIRAVLPMLGNQVIAMFKESSLLSTITVMELLAQGTSIGSIDFRFVEPLTLVGTFYFIVSYAAARLLRGLEASHAVLD